MIPIEQLRELQAAFEQKRQADSKRYQEFEKLRLSYVRRYPMAKISGLTLDEYVQGKGSKDSFCYWLEWKTSDLGHIQGTPAKKFGVFYNKPNHKYWFAGKWPNESAALTGILAEIARLLEAARVGDTVAIQQIELSPLFKGKLLFLYFPKQFLNVFSERLVDHYLSQLRLNEPGEKQDLVLKRKKLLDFKIADQVMNDWTTYEFHDFLYSTWPPSARDVKVSSKLKDYVLDFPAPDDTDPEFINLQAGDATELPTSADGGNRRKTDFDQKSRRNKLTGNQGEDVVYLAEKRVLMQAGKHNLASKVKAICKEDDTAGYDILSFELDGREKQIEVKATIAEVPATNTNFHFYFSANEYSHAQHRSNYYLYIVFDVKSKNPKIWRIQNPANLEPSRLVIKPSAYYATLTVA